MNSGILGNNWEKVGRLVPSLGRENSYEVIAAARAIGAALKAAGRDWHDLAQAIGDIGQPPIRRTPPSASTTSSTSSRCRSPSASGTPSFGDMARGCRDLDRGRLTLQERQFVSDMVRRGFTFRPSPRQTDWLDAIFDRLLQEAA